MIVTDLDIYRSAKLVIDRHGQSAHYYAASRADQLGNERDEIGAETWRRIAAAVEELQRDEPRKGEHVN